MPHDTQGEDSLAYVVRHVGVDLGESEDWEARVRTIGPSSRTPEEIQAEYSAHPAPDTKRQMWGCIICGEKRQFGEGRPDPETLKMLPFIRCNYCAGPTRHFYIGIVQE